jgi:cyclophilin family peptidyl-prolyl cis-trans isomerase
VNFHGLLKDFRFRPVLFSDAMTKNLLPILLFALAVAPSLFAQGGPPSPGGGGCTNCPPQTNSYVLPAGRSIVDLVVSNAGTIRLELFDRDKPASVRSFLSYVHSGAYSNSILHRSVTNLIVQGGSLKRIDFGGGSSALAPVEEQAVVANERGVGRFFANERGTLALAHYPGETNNATCHWFINLTNNPAFDAVNTNNAYVVFGRVIGGLDILDRLNPKATNTLVKILNLGGWLEEVPVKPTATVSTVTYADLLTTTWKVVSLDMNGSVTNPSPTVHTVSWESVSNRTHKVEFGLLTSTHWTLLWTTNGNGSRQSFTHTTNAVNGFYRLSYVP